MFYTYRFGALKNKNSEVLNYLKWLVSGSKNEDYWLKINQYTERKVIELAEKRLSEQSFKDKHYDISMTLREYTNTKALKGKLKTSTVGPLVCSATTMLCGIAALLIGPKIDSESWLFTIMIIESVLATVALGWTVIVVIKMLGEPEEPKAEEK
jgi:hypothetical protein